MQQLTIKDFFDTQFKPYSIYDNERSIPNLFDGLKITARKVLYTCIKENITKEFKVAQLASSVAFHTAYHHGEAGIGGVICGLAQNFTGSNNKNYLEPIGQFGSRLSPVPAAHRYIFTHLSENFRQFFKKEDDIILDYLYDDDQQIEPKFYIPIIPGILINGSEGIGTGFASKILPRNINEIKEYIKCKLNNKSKEFELLPYYIDFKGQVIRIETNKYQFFGVIKRINTTTIKITELPPDTYLDDIIKHLNKLLDSGFIKDYDNNSTEDAFDIDVYLPRTTINELSDEQFLDKFKLISTISENLTCWIETNKLKKFDSVNDIIDHFITFRLEKYSNRINKMIELKTEECKELSEKIRFINFYLENTTLFRNASKLELVSILKENMFSPDMLNLRIYNLTKDKINELNTDFENIKSKIKILTETTAKQQWEAEL